VSHAATMVGVKIHFGFVHPDRMGKPNVIPNPVDRLHVSHWLVSEFRKAEVVFVFGLGQMGVEVDAIFTCHGCRLTHQFACHAEGGTRREDNLKFGPGFGVMVALDQAFAIFEDVLFGVHDGIRWKPALRLPKAH